MATDSSPSHSPAHAGASEAVPSDVVAVLEKIKKHLDEEQPKKALETISQAKISSPFLLNAAGVCQLRLGNALRAVAVFRNLALGPGGLVLSPEAPTVFKTNYATALLAADNIPGCLSILGDLRNEKHPAIQKLHDAIGRWAGKLTLWQKLQWYAGGQPQCPPVLDFALGDL